MNKQILLTILTSLLGLIHELPAQVTVLPNDPRIEYTGRADFTNPQKPAIGFSGVTINCLFSGTSVKVRFTSWTTTNYYYYAIDESEPVKLNLARSTNDYLLSNSLSDTTHHLTLIRLTEGSQGTDIFEGIILNNGESLVTMPEMNRKVIEFYGNSITCGYGNETNNTSDGFKPEQENFYYSYAPVASRIMNADCIGICISGIGMYRNYGGPVTGSSNNMLTKYNNVLVSDNTKKWAFTGYTPDVVCINLGTNDTSNDLFDENIFADSCKSLLTKLRNHYPEAYMVYLTGPMMSDANTQKITSAVQGVFDELNDPKLSMFHMSGQTGDLGFGGDYHPTVAQHRENALELVDYLEGLTGWPTAPYYKSARVAADGMSVQVEVSEPLGEIPHNGGIQVILDGVPAECTSATLSDNNDDTFIVTLAKRIHQDQKVRISYRNGGIMSKNLIRLLPFYNKEAVNPVIETFIISASVHSEGTKISTLFNKRITEIEPDSFTLFIDGEEITPATDITFIIDNTNEIVMDLNDQIFDDQTIMLGLLVGAVTGFDGVINDVTANYPVENYSIISNTNVSESGDAIKVFPNPVTDRFCIAGSKATSIKHIGIYDGHGRLVAKYKSGPEGSYNVAGLARGVYFCRIYFKDNKEKVTTVKMVKR